MAVSLADKAYEVIKADIITCVLRPGQQIAQPQLAQRYGMGLTPVREALQRLAQEGFVQVVPRFGYIVSPIAISDIYEIYELRSIAESAAARLAAVRGSQEDLRRIAEQANFTYRYRDRQSYTRFLTLNSEFHLAIAVASGNKRLADLIARLLDELLRVFHLGLDLRDSAEEMRDEHVALATALLERDPVRAEQLVQGQIARSQRRVLEALTGQLSPFSAETWIQPFPRPEQGGCERTQEHKPMNPSSTARESPRLREAVVGVDREVPLLDGSRRPYAYLDNAASTPAFCAVQEKVNEFLQWYASVHRGAGFKSLLATEAYEGAREVVARFVGASPETYCVVFVKNTTEALNKLANRLNLKPDDVVLTTLMEHHSNDLPWRAKAQVVYAGLREDGSLDLEDLAQKLERHKGRVRVVTVTGASNVTGFTPPIYDIAEMAHQVGAYVVVDCAQLAPHRAVDMGDPASPRHLDFIAFSGHKMYAPFGTGVLVGPREFFRGGPPDYRGGGTIEIVNLDEVYWAEPPERDEAGSPNVVGAVALAESIRVLSQVGMEALEAYERELTRYALHRLQALPEVRVYGSSDPEQLEGRLGVISLEIKGVPHGKVAAVLAFEGGIGVRSGCFCAHPYVLNLLQVDPHEYQAYKERALHGDRSQLPGLVRVSFGCYNTLDEVDRLVEMLERIARGDYVGQYEVDRPSGMYLPRGFDGTSLRSYFAL